MRGAWIAGIDQVGIVLPPPLSACTYKIHDGYLTFMTNTVANTNTTNRAKPGKYLAFGLGHESYAVDVLKIREIIRLQSITHVPRLPNYIKGVINLRGKIIPVLDLRIKFDLPNTEATERTCIIVVHVVLPSGVSMQMGMVVDEVDEVLNIAQNDIEETPDFGTRLDTEYILGMAKVKGTVKTLLDIDRIIGMDSANYARISETSKNPASAS
jgi:purine-binding chemotaxis protein CheW